MAEHEHSNQRAWIWSRIPRVKGQDVTTAIDVTLEEIYFGAEKSIEIGFHQNCSICNGTGVIRNAICNNCDGRGLTVQTRKLRIKIPAGIHEGSKIRLTGSGVE